MKAFILSPEAERDLDIVKSYLLEEAGLRITRRVMRQLREGMRLIGRNPGLGHLREDLTEEPVRFWAVFSYHHRLRSRYEAGGDRPRVARKT